MTRVVVVTALMAVLASPSATAQSRWDGDMPVFIGLAEDGFLITVAPPTFTGCTDGFVPNALQGLPDLDLWSGTVYLDEGAPLWDMRWVFTPLGALNILWQNDGWIRVFPLTAGDIESYIGDPCGFYGTHPYVAEGPGRMSYHSADDSLNGPGANSWGWTIRGELNDHGYCTAGENPELFWVQKWVVHSQTDVFTAKSTASRGPRLTCR